MNKKKAYKKPVIKLYPLACEQAFCFSQGGGISGPQGTEKQVQNLAGSLEGVSYGGNDTEGLEASAKQSYSVWND